MASGGVEELLGRKPRVWADFLSDEETVEMLKEVVNLKREWK